MSGGSGSGSVWRPDEPEDLQRQSLTRTQEHKHKHTLSALLEHVQVPGVSGLFRQTFLLLVLVDSVHSNAGTLLLQLQLQQLPFLPFPSSVTGQACCAPAPAFRCQPFRSFGGSALCSTALHTANIAAAAAGFKEDEDSPLSSNLLKRSLPHPIPFPFPLLSLELAW